MRFYIISFVLAVILVTGCSGVMNESSIVPGEVRLENTDSHTCWGMWQFVADPAAGKLDIVQLRGVEMHLNALPFLEPPALVNLTLESLEFNGNLIEADIGLRHPFLGLSEFTGFDVCGILISDGTLGGFDNPDIIMAGDSDTRLLNPDGLSRWWNPAEFPHNTTMFGYKDGLLGTPDAYAGFSSTINGYKLFCDNLDDPDTPVDSLDPEDRCVFGAGMKNIRHYSIELGTDGLVFNYAIDASWQFPAGDPPFEVPGDFGPEANRPEAWNIVVTELANTLWNDGGSSGGGLSLLIDVWDHYNAGMNIVKAESPGNFNPVTSATAVGGGEGYSTYQVDITGATPEAGTIPILIQVECEADGYQGFVPGEDITACFLYNADVSTQGFFVTSPNGGETWDGLSSHDITWVVPGNIDYVDIYYSKDDFASDINLIEAEVDNTGMYDWLVPNDPCTTVKVKVTESGGGLEDESDNYFTIIEGSCDFGGTGFSLENDFFNIPNTYTHAGVFCSKQDSIQRLFARNYYNPGVGNNGGTIFVFNAANPLGGIVAQYDGGDPFYTNNPEAMWIDSLSEPGIDRIIYHINAAYAPNDGFHKVDWNGSAFVDHVQLPDTISFGIWRACIKPNGDIISFQVSWGILYFYIHTKSSGYQPSALYVIDPADISGMESGAWVQKMAYDPAIDAVLLLCKEQSVIETGKLYAFDAQTGDLIFSDLDVFTNATNASIAMGLNVDMENPDCRVICYTRQDDYSGNAWIVRYSADLEEKVTYSYTNFLYGLCNGDLTTDGTLWASPAENYSRFYEFSPPPDW